MSLGNDEDVNGEYESVSDAWGISDPSTSHLIDLNKARVCVVFENKRSYFGAVQIEPWKRQHHHWYLNTRTLRGAG